MTRRTASPPSITRAAPAAQGSGFSQVFDFLREQLLEGRIRNGDRLLPERELALQLGVSRPIVREALRALSMLGVVEIRERMGTVVRQPDVSVLGDVFAFSLAQAPDAMDDVMQARLALECQAIRLACRRATMADFERMKAALDALEQTIDDATAGSQADNDFHLALVRASKSETVVQLYAAMAALLARSHRDRRRLVFDDSLAKRSVIDDHRRLLEAVIAGDEDAADQALREHMRVGEEVQRRGALARRPDPQPAAPTGRKPRHQPKEKTP